MSGSFFHRSRTTAKSPSCPILMSTGGGFYKIFVQTKRGETVVTAPFVVRVASM